MKTIITGNVISVITFVNVFKNKTIDATKNNIDSYLINLSFSVSNNLVDTKNIKTTTLQKIELVSEK
ncbi:MULTISPECIES: hypothetical protein [Anaerococcus]|uniref:hypothetical protein n=1 Tax=Anaerococcus TaxID=165779 RepID=UPI0011C0ED23|nr:MULTISPECIES: hypothetical protein [Anaerococcus]MBP2069994.1 hypothetical protein [Anaerococcus nagyae]MDU1828839.1 hypothetical protein [Anaerococcus sp.]MDU1864493.1 hypothetical protein [Anaerococcus sp.]MDU2564996.1 hypothetical protein [Anaerococcus sp.]MDU3210699.1 hypothetical protein [Anaerococcus sp.]